MVTHPIAPAESSTLPKFAVIGGGISGLAAAYRLRQLLPAAHVELFEASDRLGGVLSTHRSGDFLLERGADSFITKMPWAVDLCHELGLTHELMPTNTAKRQAMVLRGNELFPVPKGFVMIRPQQVGSILQSPLLSWRGKLRLLTERWRRPPDNLDSPQFDDNLAHFATERLGREAFERLVEPLVAGIYAADANRLSVAATMPEVIDSLRKHGTLSCRDATETDSSSGARYAHFVTLQNGLSRLTDELASRLPVGVIHLNCPVSLIHLNAVRRWSLQLADGRLLHSLTGVVIALPTPQAGRLVTPIDGELAKMLGRIQYSSSAVVSMAFRNEQVGRPVSGFGYVVPRIENSDILAVSFLSVKFPGRAPGDALVARVFLGGTLEPEIIEFSEEAIIEIALRELRPVLKIHGEPELVDIARWHEKMPQYHVGHVQLVDAIDNRVALFSGLALAGNGYRGVGIPHCVRSGDQAARQLVCNLCSN